MGKPTGFLEYPRQGNPAEAPKERVRHFCEFHPRLGREERRRQGARCMECGVPFCQSGAVLNGVERPRLHRQFRACTPAAPEDQQFSGVYRTGVSRPVRGGLHLRSPWGPCHREGK